MPPKSSAKAVKERAPRLLRRHNKALRALQAVVEQLSETNIPAALRKQLQTNLDYVQYNFKLDRHRAEEQQQRIAELEKIIAKQDKTINETDDFLDNFASDDEEEAGSDEEKQ
jgi:septal ring factor EnvC (AmiA/AmiB activator)